MTMMEPYFNVNTEASAVSICRYRRCQRRDVHDRRIAEGAVAVLDGGAADEHGVGIRFLDGLPCWRSGSGSCCPGLRALAVGIVELGKVVRRQRPGPRRASIGDRVHGFGSCPCSRRSGWACPSLMASSSRLARLRASLSSPGSAARSGSRCCLLHELDIRISRCCPRSVTNTHLDAYSRSPMRS